MKRYLLLPLLVFIFTACSDHSNNEKAGTVSTDSTTEKDISFIPVTAILQSQLKSLDSVSVTILQIKTQHGKTDSSWLQAAAVKPQMAPFFTPVVEQKNLVSLFKETKFDDQSTAAITFTYDPKPALPDSFALRHWDVYFDPEKSAVRRIYLVKKIIINNAPVMQQLTWQMDKWAKIVTITNDTTNTQPHISEIKWIWDLNE